MLIRQATVSEHHELEDLQRTLDAAAAVVARTASLNEAHP